MNGARQDGSGLVVLLVEDEQPIRDIAIEILCVEGYVVLEAEHAADALAVLETRYSEIHVLFTDINMPGRMDGLALAHHVSTRWPKIRVLVTSGRGLPAAALPPDWLFLPKPYEHGHLIDRVKALAA